MRKGSVNPSRLAAVVQGSLIHTHEAAEITKGKYHDTFLGREEVRER
jgi:hypothetical protein